ncbi:MAG: hypothetical protein HY690_20395 [Chloroflexi bacterium]|nr:hypothetical protein [Chloroflexota bacterium]
MLAATALPGLLGRAFGPRDLVRVHTFLNIWDFNVYLSAMREAASTGAWLIHNHFAAEPHQPGLIHVPYVAVGQLARALGAEVMVVYGGAEALGRVLVVLATYAYVALLLPPGRARLIAFLLALLGSGLSFWVALANLLPGLGGGSPETLYYETNSLTLLFSGLHLMLALALTVAIISLFARFAWKAPGWLALLPLAGASLLLSLSHPHNLPVLASAFGLYLATAGWRAHAIPWRAVLALLAVLLGAAPVLAYDYVTFGQDPFWSASQAQQNVVLSPQGWALVGHLGLPLLLAALGLVVWREGGERRWLAGALVLATLAWMYAPLSFQRRFAFGIPLYLSAPAALGTVWLYERLPRPHWLWRRALAYGLLLGAGGTTVAMYLAVLSSAVAGAPYPSYPATVAEAAAARWLAERVQPDQAVLSGLESGYLLGGEIPGRVVLGHPHVTPHYAAKRALVLQFFDPRTSPEARLALARTLGADFVFYGPVERQLGPPPEAPGLQVIYARDGVTVYRLSYE